MRLSKRELFMVILLLVVAVVFLEFRFVIAPGIEKNEQLNAEREAVENEVNTINLNMAMAKQNEDKLNEDLDQIRLLSKRYFGELAIDALLARTHDMVVEQDLIPTNYQWQQIQLTPLNTASYSETLLSYELKELAQTYGLLTGQIEMLPETEEEQQDVTEEEGSTPVEQYQITYTLRGSYRQMLNYLDALHDLQRSLVVSSLMLVPEDIVFEDNETGDIGQAPEEVQILSMQITLNYYGIAKLTPTTDEFNQWYREPFESVEFSPFKELPIPVITTPTETEQTGD